MSEYLYILLAMAVNVSSFVSLLSSSLYYFCLFFSVSVIIIVDLNKNLLLEKKKKCNIKYLGVILDHKLKYVKGNSIQWYTRPVP